MYLDDLIERCRAAWTALMELAADADTNSEENRLLSKAQGVSLAVSYVEDYQRLHPGPEVALKSLLAKCLETTVEQLDPKDVFRFHPESYEILYRHE